MKVSEIFLFDGVDEEDRKRMVSCFNIKTQKFFQGETICDFGENSERIGIVMSGSALLIRIDRSGNRAVLESIRENDVFGENLAFSGNAEKGVSVVCEEPCEVAFIMYEHIAKRCSNACMCHTVAVENMFKVIAKKTQQLSERIEVLSNKTIREKLLCYFGILAMRAGKNAFTLPFSMTFLAEYICADRSAMARELKRMSDEGIIRNSRRKIELFI